MRLQQDPGFKQSAWRSPSHDAESQMVWPHLKIVLLVEDHSAENSERSKAERKVDRELDIHPRQRKTGTDGEEVL